MVIGGGKITHYLVELLNRHTTKANIKIIEKDRSKCESLYEALSSASLERRCLFIHGDGTNEELLIDEGIDTMDACVCLTDRDEENVFISLYAMRRGVKKVITKITIFIRIWLKSRLWLGNIITPQYITAKTVIRYVDGLSGAVGRNIMTIHQIYSGDDGNVDAIEFQVNKKQNALIHL